MEGHTQAMGRLFWLELSSFLLIVHIISVRILNGRLLPVRAVLVGILLLPAPILAGIHANDIYGDAFYILGAVLGCAAPLVTVGGIPKIRRLYICLLCFGISNMVFTLCRWVLQIAETDFPVKLLTYAIIQIVLLLGCLLFTANSVFYKAKQYIETVPLKWKVLLIVSVWLNVGFAWVLSEYTADSQASIFLMPAVCFAAANILLAGVMWPLIIFGNALNVSFKESLYRLEEQVQAQVRHYERFLQANSELRKFKHDFDNILLGLIGHVQSGDQQGALRLIHELRPPTPCEHIEIKTGNVAADALVADKRSQAGEQSVQILFNGIIPSDYISSLDLCVILGNALDNALEACEKLPAEEEKTISIQSDMRNGFLFLSVSNPVKEDVPIRNNMAATTKADKEKHGVGLISICWAMKKYDGKMTLSC
ncbi:MAG: GHKL domain-containing protein, partial [Acidobacteriota bacterium]|nr:GHKL domain-containing protein [Acidobacteriota bacterium]